MRPVSRDVWLYATLCHALVHGQAFNDRYDHGGLFWPEVGWSIEATDSAYLIFEGFGETESSEARIGWISRTADGEFVVQSTFFADSINYTCGWANTTDAHPEGGFTACGTTDSQGTAYAQVWRFDADGDSLWTRKLFIDSGYSSLGWMAKALDDGGSVAVGTVVPPGQNGEVFLVKLDPAGSILWTRTYGSSAVDRGYSLDLMQDGGFVIGGHTMGFGAGALDTYVIRTDSAGNQLWYRRFGTEYDDCVGNVTVAQDGDILVSGCKTMYMVGLNTYLRSQAIRLTPEGDVLWDRLFGPPDIFNGRLTAKEFPDGSFVAPGDQINSATGYPHGSLLKYSADGDSLWMRSYTHPSVSGWLDWHELRDVVIEPDGGVTALGYLDDLTNQDLWVIRVDSFGCLVPGCQLYDNIAEQGLQLNVLVYPNPTEGRLFLSFRSATPPAGEFTLVNISGQVVRRFRPGNSSVEIDLDISEQPTGLYLLKYEDQLGTRWEGKIIKE